MRKLQNVLLEKIVRSKIESAWGVGTVGKFNSVFKIIPIKQVLIKWVTFITFGGGSHQLTGKKEFWRMETAQKP